MRNTKQKLLDAAERLMSKQGYTATSLRQIIAEAGVNLAAAHYHFGSKERLLHAMLDRKVGPVNEERLALLERAEAVAEQREDFLEKILEAFLAPVFQRRLSSPQFIRLMGRLYGEGLMTWVAENHYRSLGERFQAALHRALPELTAEELEWRIQLMIGAMAHTMFYFPEGPCAARPLGAEEVLERMVTFLAAG